MALPTYKFEPEATLTILNKFNIVFAALCTGKHPTTQNSLPGIVGDHPLVTRGRQKSAYPQFGRDDTD